MELGSYATLFNDSMSATRYEIMQRYVNSEDKFARWRGKDKRMWRSLYRERVRNDPETLVAGLVPSADRGAGRGGSPSNYRRLAIRKGAPSPTMLLMFLAFSLVSLFVYYIN